MTTTAHSRTSAANQARRQRADQGLERVRQALAAMRKQRLQVTYPAVAGRARVSRTFLYQNQQARALMTEAISQAGVREHRHQAEQDAQAEAAWRERALNAEEGLKAAHAEIRAQRERIAVLMGQVRDMESDYSEESAQRLATENTTLKQRARRLAEENRSLEEKLQAARSNNRFLDKRIATLEADLLARPPAPS